MTRRLRMAGTGPPSPQRPLDRRAFLRGSLLAGIGLGVAGSWPDDAAAAGRRSKRVYRLSTRDLSVCNACKGHAANRYYRLRRFADHHRAHRGCNCRILVQRVTRREWKEYFVRRDGTWRKVFDVRRKARK